MRQKDVKSVKDIKNRKYLYGAVLRSIWFKTVLAYLAVLGFFYPSFVLAEEGAAAPTSSAGNDLLINLLPSLRATFGPGSVVLKGFYLMVIAVGVWRYHITGNLAPVASIVIVVLVVTFGMSHLVFN